MADKTIFDKLLETNVSEYTDTKDNGSVKLTYLSWTYAWSIFKQTYPRATYEIIHWDGKPYLFDENLGYMVETVVDSGTEKLSMWLTVMDGANKAMKDKPYKYMTKKGEKTVEPASMFDINTAIMRCLTKNISMFGLGLYIYAGEDIPKDSLATATEKEQTRTNEKLNTMRTKIKDMISKLDPEINLTFTDGYETETDETKLVNIGIQLKKLVNGEK